MRQRAPRRLPRPAAGARRRAPDLGRDERLPRPRSARRTPIAWTTRSATGWPRSTRRRSSGPTSSSSGAGTAPSTPARAATTPPRRGGTRRLTPHATGHPMVSRDRIIRWLLIVHRERSGVHARPGDGLRARRQPAGHSAVAQLPPAPPGRSGPDRAIRAARRPGHGLHPGRWPRPARYNSDVRVIRNAVAPERYAPPPRLRRGRSRSSTTAWAPATAITAICQDAVDAVAPDPSTRRRIWLGSDEPEIRAIVDEATAVRHERRADLRRTAGCAAAGDRSGAGGAGRLQPRPLRTPLARVLARRRGDGRVADHGRRPVRRDPRRSGRVARPEQGPVAGAADEARRRRRRCARRLAGRARERVLAEYDVRERVAEWADAFRWAADHAGRGVATAWTGGFSATERAHREAAAEGEARLNLAHRRIVRARSIEERETLERLRAGRDVCWPDGAEDNPLVSVVIPTYDRGRILIWSARSRRSWPRPTRTSRSSSWAMTPPTRRSRRSPR